ncbi:hypothetical protein D3C83_113660 [compost metagenome]
MNISRELTIDTEGPGRWRGMPGSLNAKQLLEQETITEKELAALVAGGREAQPVPA